MKVIYDIETLANCFVYCDLNKNTQEINTFVIHKDRNDFSLLFNHLEGLSGQIGFNNCAFDGQIIQYILNSSYRWTLCNGEEIARMIYQKAQEIIERSNSGKWPEIPEWEMHIKQLDLFLIWHFNNRAKMTSLKWVEYGIDMPNIQEMPIHHTKEITKEEIPIVVDYCINDIKATYEFYKITKGETELPLYKGVDKIKLRQDIQAEFGINCMNYNDVKIGDAINKKFYCQVKGIDKKDIPRPFKSIDKFQFKDCFPSYYKFETIEFQNFVKLLSTQEVNLNKKQSFEFTFNETTYLIAKGGLHSKDKPRAVIPKDSEILMDCDIGSMYPNIIRKRGLFPRHLGQEWLKGYTTIIEKRLEAKKQGKKAIDEAYKLALNGGGFGKTNEENSWQYDPKVTMDVTIGGQIEILMLIEKLETNGIHIISANTDGLLCLFNSSQIDVYYKICKDWEIQVGNDILGCLEYTQYNSFYQTSVNDYIAIKTKDKKIKTKGDFMTDFELHKNKSARIIPIALNEYFVNNKPIDETINNHSNIYDFCLGVKSIGKNKLFAFNKSEQSEQELQKINRYYISNEGVHIIKKLPKLDNKKALMQLDIFGNVDDGTREAEIEAGFVSTIFNQYKESKDYGINYSYYVNNCNKIIKQIER